MKTFLTLETHRTDYAPTAVGDTMTVGELISLLKQYPQDIPVVLSNDNGYTYGEVREEDFNTLQVEDEEDED